MPPLSPRGKKNYHNSQSKAGTDMFHKECAIFRKLRGNPIFSRKNTFGRGNLFRNYEEAVCPICLVCSNEI